LLFRQLRSLLVRLLGVPRAAGLEPPSDNSGQRGPAPPRRTGEGFMERCGLGGGILVRKVAHRTTGSGEGAPVVEGDCAAANGAVQVPALAVHLSQIGEIEHRLGLPLTTGANAGAHLEGGTAGARQSPGPVSPMAVGVTDSIDMFSFTQDRGESSRLPLGTR